MCRKLIFLISLIVTLGLGLTLEIAGASEVKINFQSTGSQIPEGYLPDYGEVFGDRGNGWSYGWSQDMTSRTRDRNNANAPDQRYDTLIHFQPLGGVWEIELPNGTYNLYIVCGDPAYADTINDIMMEGETLAKDPDGIDQFDEFELTVTIADGRLTWSEPEGAYVKPCFIEIEGETLTQFFLKARDPNPADGAEDVSDPLLMWTPGDTAVFQRVYFGTDPDNLVMVSEQVSSVYWHPEAIEPGVRYYWRIDGIDADGSVITGDVWSFVAQSLTAWGPSPSDGGTDVLVDIPLSWNAGHSTFPLKHHLFFGTDEAEVAAGTGDTDKGILEEAMYDPGMLEADTTYYFRVNEIEMFTSDEREGKVWSFTTVAPGPGKIIREWWFDINGDTVTDLTSNARYPNNPSGREFVSLFEGPTEWAEQYGSRLRGWLFIPETGDYTFLIDASDEGEIRLSPDENPAHAVMIASTAGEEESQPQSLVAGERYYIEALMKAGSMIDSISVSWEGPSIGAMQVISADYVGATPYLAKKAYAPFPPNGASDVKQTTMLRWSPGALATSHMLYFGTDKNVVENATIASPEYIGTQPLGEESYEPGELAWNTTYYWRVDEANDADPESPWQGPVWSFTTAGFVVVDDFESYTDNDVAGEAIWQSWIDGFGVADNGAQVGYLLPPYAEQTIVHSGYQSMLLLYNNTADVTNSEAVLTLTSPRDWTENSVVDFSLWFKGIPASAGSFVEDPVGTYTITAEGADIWNTADEFHYAFKTLTGAGSIEAQVLSVMNTDPWAKAGVMIRETLEPGSKFAAVYMTPENGCRFQARVTTDADATSDTSVATAEQTALTSPYRVKLERTVGGSFRGYYSSDGANWTSMSWNPQMITMASNVYVGLALTSHSGDMVCEAKFSNVRTTGTVGAQWANQNIGIASNAAEPLYVAVSNASGSPAVVAHEDPAVATIDEWTEWRIPLQSFTDQGINLTNVDKIAIGLGSKSGMITTGGSGTMYIDDIRLYRP